MKIKEIKKSLPEHIEIIHTPLGIMYHNKQAKGSEEITEKTPVEFDVIDWIYNSPDIDIDFTFDTSELIEQLKI